GSGYNTMISHLGLIRTFPDSLIEFGAFSVKHKGQCSNKARSVPHSALVWSKLIQSSSSSLFSAVFIAGYWPVLIQFSISSPFCIKSTAGSIQALFTGKTRMVMFIINYY
ncbi:hypothetical protein, partial [Shewanella algae]|uniref:hypothetical protein n=1 Tax=Shewanella algae TaxID=38313 RepID=UPI00300414F1